DSGGLLLWEGAQRRHMLKRLAGGFVDHRDANQIEPSVESLIKQRVMGLAWGYEDRNDHDTWRHAPLRSPQEGEISPSEPPAQTPPSSNAFGEAMAPLYAKFPLM
ncbi:MAG: transposase, partial [Nitrospinae bacterium]|nr:transposase [Nitrospinota bacterium]